MCVAAGFEDFADMTDTNGFIANDSAEKAYAAAAEAVSTAPGSNASGPSSDQGAAEPFVERAIEPAIEPMAEIALGAEADAEAAAVTQLPAFNPVDKGKGGRGKAKRSPVNPAIKIAPAAAFAPTPSEAADATIEDAAALLAAATAKLAAADLPNADTAEQPEEPTMDATTTSNNFAEGVKGAMFGVQMKAKDAFTKSTAAVGEYGEFAKGNVEAMVESGKILASGIQGMSSKLVADGKTAIETMTADVKQLASIKSPADFVQVQSEIMRRNFDAAMSLGTKNSEAMLKLVSDAFAPISGRVTLAVDKVRQVA